MIFLTMFIAPAGAHIMSSNQSIRQVYSSCQTNWPAGSETCVYNLEVKHEGAIFGG